MLKKLSLLVSIAVLAAISGCATIKSNDLRVAELTPNAQPVPTVADLEVSGKKVLGEAQGKTAFKRNLEQEAIAEALKETNADVLVGPSFFYEEKGGELTVTVVGYPARYKNFRPKEVPQADILVGGDFFYKDGSNDLSVTVKNIKPDAPQKPAAAAQKPQQITAPAPAPAPAPIPAPAEENAQ